MLNRLIFLAVTHRLMNIQVRHFIITGQLHSWTFSTKFSSSNKILPVVNYKQKINWNHLKKTILNSKKMFKINSNSSKSLLHQWKPKWWLNFNNSCPNSIKNHNNHQIKLKLISIHKIYQFKPIFIMELKSLPMK